MPKSESSLVKHLHFTNNLWSRNFGEPRLRLISGASRAQLTGWRPPRGMKHTTADDHAKWRGPCPLSFDLPRDG